MADSETGDSGNHSSSVDSGRSGTTQRAGAAKSRATVRASLACVPCRSRHLKCESTLPACLRCRLEEKTCYYAKSRRGIRDPKKRSLIGDSPTPPTPTADSPGSFPSPELASFDIPIKVIDELPGGWSLRRNPSTSAGQELRPLSPTSLLFDLYYANFHDTHPWLLPKKELLDRLKLNAPAFRFIVSCITFVGSLFSSAISSEELRERAYGLASGSLPITSCSVQGLLILSIAAFGESRIDLSGRWLDRAVEIALQLGMQHKEYADAETEPIMAESHRRTYWALYFHDSTRSLREGLPIFPLYSVPATAELPCEEWEYQSGEIPQPVSLDQYDKRDPMADRAYSSWAYAVDLARICGELILPLPGLPTELLQEAMDMADSKILRWLLNLPKWKQMLVDSDGVVDMVLHHSISFAHSLRVRTQLPLHMLDGDLRSLIARGPLFSKRGGIAGPQPSSLIAPDFRWYGSSTALQAALSVVGLFNFSLPPDKYSPSHIMGLRQAAIVLLDSRLYSGYSSPVLRDKLDLLLGVFKSAGEIWPVARSIGMEVSAILQELDASTEGGTIPTLLLDPAWDAFISRMIPTLESYDSEEFQFTQDQMADEMTQWPSSFQP